MRCLFVLIGAVAVLGFAMPAIAGDASDTLKPLLVDLEGWTAEAAQGSAVSMGGIKMTTATRTYEKDDSSVDASIVVGSNAMIEGQTQVPTVETDEVKMSRTKIDGYDVIQTYDKKEKSGAIIITLAKKDAAGAMLLINFDQLTGDDALALAKKLDWKKIKEAAEKLL